MYLEYMVGGTWRTDVYQGISPPSYESYTIWHTVVLSTPTMGSDITQFRFRLAPNGRNDSSCNTIDGSAGDKVQSEIIVVSYSSNLISSTLLAEGSLNWFAVGA